MIFFYVVYLVLPWILYTIPLYYLLVARVITQYPDPLILHVYNDSLTRILLHGAFLAVWIGLVD